MALEISVSITNTKDSVILVDTTGDYEVTSNPGGWGSPNDARIDVASATVTVTSPDGSVLANPEDVLTFFALGADYDLTTYIETESTLSDGVWKFQFSLTGVSDAAVTSYGLRDIELKTKLAQLALGDLESNDFAEYDRRYRILLLAFEQGEYTTVQEIMEDLSSDLDDCLSGDTNIYGLDCGC
jgi:hypothetical protein